MTASTCGISAAHRVRLPAIADTGSRTQSDAPHDAPPQLAQQIEAADFVDAPAGIEDRSGLAQLLEPPAVVKLPIDDEGIAGGGGIGDHGLVMALERHTE